MAPQRIILLTFEGQFAQSLDRFESMDLDAIRAHLGQSGFTTDLSEYAELVEQGVDEQAIYVCGSHQNREVKAYIDDVLLARFADRLRA